jgi:hypothetical protein
MTPDWLAQHRGTLQTGPDGTWYVVFDGKPNYSLIPRTLGSKFTTVIRQTINGKQTDAPGGFSTADDALRAGLEELRKMLGW